MHEKFFKDGSGFLTEYQLIDLNPSPLVREMLPETINDNCHGYRRMSLAHEVIVTERLLALLGGM